MKELNYLALMNGMQNLEKCSNLMLGRSTSPLLHAQYNPAQVRKLIEGTSCILSRGAYSNDEIIFNHLTCTSISQRSTKYPKQRWHS